jgi:Flp pilus assembly protein TadD
VWVLVVLLVLVTIALYWPATGHDFVMYDDPDFLTENPHVQGGLNWEGVKWAFGNTERAAYWAPVMWLSHMLAWQFFGGNAWGHHLLNVLLHAANSALVFLVLGRMTGAVWRSLMVAALFGLHPLRVESVAWVTERKDVLSASFGLLTLLAYACYAEKESQKAGSPGPKPEATGRRSGVRPLRAVRLRRPAGPWSGPYLLCLFWFTLGLLSKPVLGVTLPFILLLLDYWPLGRMQNAEWRMEKSAADLTRHTSPSTPQAPRLTPWRLVIEKVPFFLLAAGASFITVMAQKQEGALASRAILPLGARVANALISYGRYLGKLCWPADLAVFYPRPDRWPVGQVVLAGGLLLGLTALARMKRRRCPYWPVGWLWFLGALLPVIGLVQAGEQAMADRWTYLASLGVLIPAVWGAYELTRTWRHHGPPLLIASGAVVVLYLALTRQQIGCWRDSESLFRHALAVTKDNWLAHNNLGYALGQKGQDDEAMGQYEAAIRLKPRYAEARSNLGAALNSKGRIDEAIRQFREVVRLKPHEADVYSNLGAALVEKGQTDEAIRQLEEALRLKPDHARARNYLGLALGLKGQMDEAIRQYQEALRLKPDYAEAHYNLGLALAGKGQTGEAIRQYQETVRLKPDDAEAHNSLGVALDDQGQAGEAVRQYQETLRLKPGHAEAHYNLGNALGRQGQIDEAIRHYKEAIRLKPDYAAAYNNLGIALYQQRRFDEAIGRFQEALRLQPDLAGARRNLDAVLAAKARGSPPSAGATNP